MRISDWSSDVCSSDLERRIAEVAAADVNAAAALGPEVAHRGGDGREGVQRIAELVEAERLHVVLQIGRLARRVRFREGTELADRKSTRLNSSHSCASRMPSSA